MGVWEIELCSVLSSGIDFPYTRHHANPGVLCGIQRHVLENQSHTMHRAEYTFQTSTHAFPFEGRVCVLIWKSSLCNELSWQITLTSHNTQGRQKDFRKGGAFLWRCETPKGGGYGRGCPYSHCQFFLK